MITNHYQQKKRMMGRQRPMVKFQIPKDAKIEYKNLALLQRFVSDRGKIISRRVSGLSAVEQRRLASAIKMARFLALLPTGGVMKR